MTPPRGKPPAMVVLVSMALPSGDFVFQIDMIDTGVVQALARQNGEFGFGHIEPPERRIRRRNRRASSSSKNIGVSLSRLRRRSKLRKFPSIFFAATAI